MNILGFIDKIDDIALEGVQTVRTCIEKPINYLSDKAERKMEMTQEEWEYEIERRRKEDDVELEQRKKRMEMELAELEADNELRRRTEIVEAMKKYRIELTAAVTESVNQISTMSVELREKADVMVTNTTKRYLESKEQIKTNTIERVKEINETFSDNEEMKKIMTDALMTDMMDMIKLCNNFISDLKDDLINLKKTIDVMAEEGHKGIERYLNGENNSIPISLMKKGD